MAIDQSVPRSRRVVLGAMLGSVAALAAEALGRPKEASAVQGQAVIAGTNNSETMTTAVYNYASGADPAFLGDSDSGTGVWGNTSSGWGVLGQSVTGTGVYATGGTGVYATGSLDYGVRGHSFAVAGVYGSGGPVGVYGDGAIGVSGYSFGSTAAIAVKGESPEGRGVLGLSTSGTGVHGFAGSGAEPSPSPKTGVYGRSDIDASSRGVSGYSAAGTGMWGNTASGTGLYGAASASTGYALRTSGRVAFGKVSGVATIAAGAFITSAIATGTDVTPSSYVLFSPQGDPGTRRFWATLSTTNNTVTIHTNASSASPFKVAWLLVG